MIYKQKDILKLQAHPHFHAALELLPAFVDPEPLSVYVN